MVPSPPERTAAKSATPMNRRRLNFESLETRALLTSGVLESYPLVLEQQDAPQSPSDDALWKQDCSRCHHRFDAPIWSRPLLPTARLDVGPSSRLLDADESEHELGEGEFGEGEFVAAPPGPQVPETSDESLVQRPSADTHLAAGGEFSTGDTRIAELASLPAWFEGLTQPLSSPVLQRSPVTQQTLAAETDQRSAALDDVLTEQHAALQFVADLAGSKAATSLTLDDDVVEGLLSGDLLVALAESINEADLSTLVGLGSTSEPSSQRTDVDESGTTRVPAPARQTVRIEDSQGPTQIPTQHHGITKFHSDRSMTGDDAPVLISLSHDSRVSRSVPREETANQIVRFDLLKTDSSGARYQAFELAQSPPAKRVEE